MTTRPKIHQWFNTWLSRADLFFLDYFTIRKLERAYRAGFERGRKFQASLAALAPGEGREDA